MTQKESQGMPWYKIVIIFICAAGMGATIYRWFTTGDEPPLGLVTMITIVLYALFPAVKQKDKEGEQE